MPIISASGLFAGDRLCRCSNEARLFWPYFYVASNGYGRFEINPAKIISTVFMTFSPRPAATEIEAYIREYRDAHLLFLYEANGQVWGQWDTPANMLPRHKKAEDKRSPAPPPAEFERWLSEYHDPSRKHSPVSENFRKVLGDLPKTDQISENCGVFPENSASFLHGVGVGGGGGEGKGKNKKPSAATSSTADAPEIQTGDEPDPRHAPIRELIQRLHLEKFKIRAEWDGSEAKALDRLLSANPRWTVDQISAMVRNRFNSEGVTSARARKWIASLGEFASGPLDRYGRVDEHQPTRQVLDTALGTRRHHSEPQELVPSIDLPRALDREAGTAEWKLAQGKLGERLNVHTYETWIKPTRGEGVHGDTLYVCVPTSEFEVIGDRFNREIREALPDHIATVKYFYLAPAPAHQSN